MEFYQNRVNYFYKKKKADRITMGIKHRADRAFRKFSAPRKLCLGGQVRSYGMPYVS
jgi:hypothetical protein